MAKKQVYEVYTDGAAQPNLGHGGYGYVILDKISGGIKEQGGYCGPDKTNNQMELTAALKALKTLENGAAILLYSDSRYLVDGMTKWVKGWSRNGWKVSNGQDIKNKDLWVALDTEVARLSVMWRWVKGHATNKYNNRCDQLATQAVVGRVAITPKGSITRPKKQAKPTNLPSKRSARELPTEQQPKYTVTMHHTSTKKSVAKERIHSFTIEYEHSILQGALKSVVSFRLESTDRDKNNNLREAFISELHRLYMSSNYPIQLTIYSNVKHLVEDPRSVLDTIALSRFAKNYKIVWRHREQN